MHDAGPQFAALARQRRTEMVQQGVDQRARLRGLPRPGVNGHPRRLVDRGDVIVFVKNFERDVFGEGVQRL